MTGSLRIKHKTYYMLFSWKDESGQWRQKSESTGIPERLLAGLPSHCFVFCVWFLFLFFFPLVFFLRFSLALWAIRKYTSDFSCV